MEKSLTFGVALFALFVWVLAVEGDAEWRSELDRCESHFKLKLISLDGEWESYVHYAAEDGTAIMPDNNCEKVTWFQEESKSSAEAKIQLQVQHPMIVSANAPVVLGHQNGHYKDFYGVLTVTMTRKPNDTPDLCKKEISKLLDRDTLSSPPPKMCVFYIGAKGPALPVLHNYGFQGAICTLKLSEVEPLFILTAK